MARIRGRGNKETELALAKLLRRERISGWRRRQRLLSRPDFVFWRQRVAVFVDGCFWHACPVHATRPQNNAAFWRKKLAANQARDRFVTHALRRAGWRVLRIWEHELARKNASRLRQNSALLGSSGRLPLSWGARGRGLWLQPLHFDFLLHRLERGVAGDEFGVPEPGQRSPAHLRKSA